jgi:hypothetical protein
VQDDAAGANIEETIAGYLKILTKKVDEGRSTKQ